MKVFQNTEMLPVLLMKYVQSREQKQYRVSTVFILTSQKIESSKYDCEPRKTLAHPYLDPKFFGDLITTDHNFLSEESESRNNHRYAVVVQDLATQWIQSYSCKTKTFQETQKSLQKFLEPNRKPEVIYTDGFSMDSFPSVQNQDLSGNTKKLGGRKPKVIYADNSLELDKACEDLFWNHCTSTPHRSETNGIAARAIRRVKEGTSVVLLQSGLDESWWADSLKCYCYLRNIQDLLSDGKTPHERRFGEPFKGPMSPLGSLVEYYPIAAKDQSGIHQFGKKVLPGLFLGYALNAGEFGRVTYWLQTLRSWRRWTHRKSMLGDSMQRMC